MPTHSHWAKLIVQPQAARWISREEWRLAKRGRWLGDGRFDLQIPYADETEIVMDVLRKVDPAMVVEPESLASAVHARLSAASAQYAPVSP